MRRIVIAIALAALALSCPTAHADANSYLAYLQSHGTYAGGQAKALNAGFYACQALHAGQTPEQIAGGAGMTFMNVPRGCRCRTARAVPRHHPLKGNL